MTLPPTSPSLRGSGLKLRMVRPHRRESLSPSLRGSGLKLIIPYLVVLCKCRLPLYEGVDWNVLIAPIRHIIRVSLFTREWIEISNRAGYSLGAMVSLFTREWIEMPAIQARLVLPLGLPLYEGVDWNCNQRICLTHNSTSPSLRGSGLKWPTFHNFVPIPLVSLFTREWIEMHLLPSIPV